MPQRLRPVSVGTHGADRQRHERAPRPERMAMRGEPRADETRARAELRRRQRHIAEVRRQMALENGQDHRRKHVDPFGDASGHDHRLAAQQRDRAGDRRAKRRARLAQRLQAHPVACARRRDQRSPVRPAGAPCDGVERRPRGVAFEPAEARVARDPTGRRRPNRRKPRRRLAHARSAHPQERPNRCRCRSQEG